jgi:GNAT superfamily N-acetyltransferase
MGNPGTPLCVRPAVAGDVPRLCELLAILFAQEAEFRPDAARQSAGLRLILEQPGEGVILCAEEDGQVVGMAVLLFTVSTAEGGRAAWLEDVVVDPDRRGGGVGAALLAACVDQARASGCRRITLLTDGANEAAIRFYGRRGFVASPMIPLRLAL